MRYLVRPDIYVEADTKFDAEKVVLDLIRPIFGNATDIDFACPSSNPCGHGYVGGCPLCNLDNREPYTLTDEELAEGSATTVSSGGEVQDVPD